MNLNTSMDGIELTDDDFERVRRLVNTQPDADLLADALGIS